MPPQEETPVTLADFEAGRADAATFGHREHVRMTYELLERYTFPEALFRLSKGLRRLAANAGVPEKYHETITVAFLAVIGERRVERRCADWEEFAAQNPDLLQKELLAEIYAPEVLNSPLARETFLLP